MPPGLVAQGIYASGLQSKPLGVEDGVRIHDAQNHNLVIYQLIYLHHRWRPGGNLKASAQSSLTMLIQFSKTLSTSMVVQSHPPEGGWPLVRKPRAKSVEGRVTLLGVPGLRSSSW